MKQTIRDLSTLKKLEKAGYITLHHHTGKTVNGLFGPVKAWYIQDNTASSFEHDNRKFEIEYVDGCFYPFVFEIS